MHERMSTENSWNETNKGNLNYSDYSLSSANLSTSSPGIEPVSPQAYKYQLRNCLLFIADG